MISLLFFALLCVVRVEISVSVVITVPGTYPTISDALYNAQSGDTIQLLAGEYEGSGNCPLYTDTPDLTLVGAGSEKTKILCDSSLGQPLFVNAGGFTLSNLTMLNTKMENGTGLLMVAGPSVTVSRCVFSNGIATGPPAYSYRQTGGALNIAPPAQEGPIEILLDTVVFENNTALCNEYQCAGGAVYVFIENSDGLSQGNITISNCYFSSNTVVANGTANSMLGGAISLNNEGVAPLAITIENTIFEDSLLVTSETMSPSLYVTTGGAAIAVYNIKNFQDPEVASPNVSIVVHNTSFVNSIIQNRLCGSLSNSDASGGAISIWGPTSMYIEGSSFKGGICICNSSKTSGESGIASGGAIFVQGQPVGTSPGLEPVITIANSSFLSNIASCVGTSCLSLGGAINVATAMEFYLGNITAISNVAVCAGIACGSAGGFTFVQNGPLTVSVIPVMNFIVENLIASDNAVIQNVALPGWSAPCSAFICNNPNYGGAIGAQLFSDSLIINASFWRSNNNTVTCNQNDCVAFGPMYGASIVPLYNVELVLKTSIESSEFYYDCLSCSGEGCMTLDDTWSANYEKPTEQNGTLYVGGAGCSFVGTSLPSGTSVSVSPQCTSSADSVCNPNDGNDDSNSSSAYPSSIPTSTPSNFSPNDVDDTNKGLSKLSTIILAVVLSVVGLLLIAGCIHRKFLVRRLDLPPPEQVEGEVTINTLHRLT